MKVIYNYFIPLGKFTTINLFGVLFVRADKTKKILASSLNHESIHTEQMKELLYIGFYILYFIFWLERIIWNTKHAYKGNPFEQEAYNNERNFRYIENRTRYAWKKYLLKRYKE